MSSGDGIVNSNQTLADNFFKLNYINTQNDQSNDGKSSQYL